jgi:Ring finger domain
MSMAAAFSSFHWRSNSPRHSVVVNQEEEDRDVEEGERPRRVEHAADTPPPEDEEQQGEIDAEEDDIEAAPVIRPPPLINNETLRELEEERELVRRRTSVCLWTAVFLLFRLWIEALTQADFGLLMLCLVGTSWCARFIRHNREREEELDRRIQAYMENNEDGEGRPDFRMLSFQAQLALAIMESQRQMMQGGYGHPDGHAHHAGVSDEARSRWEKFKFKTVEDAPPSTGKKGDYGSVVQDDGDESPSCTICLGEYEDGEELVKLPCDHCYHNECIGAWTAEHSKCPLCNFDLESVPTPNSGLAVPVLREDLD